MFKIGFETVNFFHFCYVCKVWKFNYFYASQKWICLGTTNYFFQKISVFHKVTHSTKYRRSLFSCTWKSFSSCLFTNIFSNIAGDVTIVWGPSKLQEDSKIMPRSLVWWANAVGMRRWRLRPQKSNWLKPEKSRPKLSGLLMWTSLVGMGLLNRAHITAKNLKQPCLIYFK